MWNVRKTVQKPVKIDEIENSIPEDVREYLIRELREDFGDEVSVWGFPEGAKNAISTMKKGDIVLLAEKASMKNGRIPILCEVETFYNRELPSLSLRLWGSNRYPYVFFCTKEMLRYSWAQFIDDMEYHVKFNPRGKAMRISERVIDNFGNPDTYLDYILSNYSLGED